MKQKISEFIKRLEEYKEAYGDIYVAIESVPSPYHDIYLDINMEIRNTETDDFYIGINDSQHYLCLS